MRIQYEELSLTANNLSIKLLWTIKKNTKHSVLIRKRSTNEEFVLIPEMFDDVISINLDLLPRSSEPRELFDVFYCEDQNIYRLYRNSPDVRREYQYHYQFYQLDYANVIVPYLTLNKELSLLYGDAVEVFKTYCKPIYNQLDIQTADIQEDKYGRLKMDFLSYMEDSYIALYNTRTKKYITLEHEYDVQEGISISIKNANIPLKVGDIYKLCMIQKENYILNISVLGTSKIDDEALSFYKPIRLDHMHKFVPYYETNGTVVFLVAEDSIIGDILSIKRNKPVFVEDILKEDHLLDLRLNTDLGSMRTDSFQILLINSKDKETYILTEDEYYISGKCIRLNLYELIQANKINKEQRWEIQIAYEDHGELRYSQIYMRKFGNDINGSYQIELLDDLVAIPHVVHKTGCLEIMILAREDRKERALPLIKGYTHIQNLHITSENIEFELLDSIDANFYRVLMKERKTGLEWWATSVNYHSEDKNKAVLKFNWTDFIDQFASINSRWDLYLEVNYQNRIERNKVGIFHNPVYKSSDRYFSPISTGFANVVTPYYTIKNELAVVIKPLFYLFGEKNKTKSSIKRFDMKKNQVSIVAEIEVMDSEQYSVGKGKLKLRNKAIDLQHEFSVRETKVAPNRSLIEMTLDLDNFDFVSFYWDFYIQLRIGQDEGVIKLKNPTKRIIRAINNKTLSYEHTYSNNFVVYPYITLDKSVALCYREKADYESASYKIKENVTYYLYKVLQWYYNRREIWLGFEKFAETAQDNGYYFYKYCLDHNKHKDFYYVIKKSSPEYEILKKEGFKLIEHMSFKYMLYSYAAKLLISSEAKANIYDIKIQRGKLKANFDRKKFVFLQHGVMGFKRVDSTFRKSKDKSRPKIVDLFVVSSEMEKKIIKDYFGYNEKEIILTGLCRWDAIENKVDENNKQIFLMPTWRTWLEGISDEEFVKTDYYQNYVSLLNDRTLSEMLEEHNIVLNFLLHPKFKDYIDQFQVNTDKIKIYKFGEQRVNEVLMKSSMLITDYSSVAWDMYYQKKPIVFFQFDYNEQVEFQGSYIDMEKDLFGERALNKDQLVSLIKKYIDNDFAEEQRFIDMRPDYFSYIDQDNCERTYDAIMTRKDKLLAEAKRENPILLKRIAKRVLPKKMQKKLRSRKGRNI